MVLSTFGKRLKLLRVDRGISQAELRDRMEKEAGVAIGETYVSELERTDKMPSLEVAAAMARVLDVSVDYLCLLVDEATSYRPAPMPTYFSAEADELAQLIDTLHPAQRGLLLDVARHMASPAVQRRHIVAHMRAMLESVEEELGADARARVERNLRRRWLSIDFDS